MGNWYADPTANTAIAHVDREIRRKEKQENPPSRPRPAPALLFSTPSLTEAERRLIALWPVQEGDGHKPVPTICQ